MDTNNLQLTNNFYDGMNTDTSDAFLSESSYRLANNLRFITNEQENSGELRMIEGVKGTPDKTFDEEIIATTSLRDIPIYITQTNVSWKVYYGDRCVAHVYGTERVVKTEYKHPKLSLVARYESDDNKHLYIADGQGPMLCVQLEGEYKMTENGYVRLRDLESVPSVLFNKPIFCGLIDGNIKGAVVEYSYQFYKKHGQLSEISPSTKLIPLFKGALTAKESSRTLGYLPDEQSDKGVKIKIPYNLDTITPFDRIKIFRISYIEAGQLPQIECVYDEKIPENQLNYLFFEDRGQQSLAVYSLEEYNAMTGIHIIPKTIESKDDYLFAANVKDDSTGFDVSGWDSTTGVTLLTVTTKLIGDNTTDADYVIQKPSDTLSSAVTMSDGNTFNISSYVDVKDENQLNKDILSYANPQVSYMFKSLRRGEKYRFGVIFYDNKGRSSGVVHLKDIEIEQDDFFGIENGKLIVKPKGIKFRFNSFPTGAVSYEIVRCGKSLSDTSTITQGFLSRPIAREYSFSAKPEIFPLTPTGLVTVHDFTVNAAGLGSDKTTYGYLAATNTNQSLGLDGKYKFKGCKDIFQFISPEVCYNQQSTKDITNEYELQLCPIKYVCPSAFSTPNPTIKYLTFYEGNTNMGTFERVNYGNKYANINATWWNDNAEEHDYDLNGLYGREVLALDYIPIIDSNGEEYTRYDLKGGVDFADNIYNADSKRYSYAKLYYDYLGTKAEPYNSYEVNSVGFPETLNWDDFATPAAEKFLLIYTDKVTAVGGRNFVNWVCGPMYGKTDQGDWANKINTTASGDGRETLADGSYDWIWTMGPGGKCAVISIQDTEGSIANSAPEKAIIGTYICNLKKKSTLINSEDSKKNSTYRSFGDYFTTDTTEGYIFNGDCFIAPFEYVAQHKFSHPSSIYWRTACKIFVVPLETSINLAYTSGYEFNKEFDRASGDVTFIQNDAGNVNNQFVQDKPLYSYNAAYSTIDTSRTYVAKESIDPDDKDIDTDCRVFHSNVKTNNEYVDNWIKFMPANFLDVDTRKGPITGLRTFKNQLVFWQEYATGVLSVNERSVISDDSNMPLILGSGGVLTRFDYITNTNGMHENDYSDAQSNTTLYWWDRINKSLCGYSGGQDAIELSKIKFVQNYLNKNEPTDNPVVAYDNKTKEVVANVVDGTEHEYGSLVYNEHLGHFTSLYTIKPEHKVELPEGILFTSFNEGLNKSFVYEWNVLDQSGNVYGLNGQPLYPYLKHVVNKGFVTTKVFDNAEFGGRVYGGDEGLDYLRFAFSTPLKQYGELSGDQIENREYNFRYVIPRNQDENGNTREYGDRLRGKTMQCELWANTNSYDLSLQYITTKFRASWS